MDPGYRMDMSQWIEEGIRIKPFQLDIGCGLNQKEPKDEWIHLDMYRAPHIEIVCDFKKIPLDNESVDIINMTEVIEHIPRYEQTEALMEWRRILKPGGILAGTTPNVAHIIREVYEGRMSLDEAVSPHLYGWGDRPGEIHYQTFYIKSLTKFLEDNGFKAEPNTTICAGSPGPIENPWWIVFRAIKA